MFYLTLGECSQGSLFKIKISFQVIHHFINAKEQLLSKTLKLILYNLIATRFPIDSKVRSGGLVPFFRQKIFYVVMGSFF